MNIYQYVTESSRDMIQETGGIAYHVMQLQ
jgi:hypothetical protein